VIISLIVAAAENGVIGSAGTMPWRLPAESAYFRQTTMGHPVITGRKNYEAMGRPLPDRLNVVITRQADYKVPDGVIVAGSLDDALELPQVRGEKEVFIIGGAQIYNEAMSRADKLYLTHVHATVDGDTFFRYNPAEWKLIKSERHEADEQNKYAFTIQVLDHRK
jgi:dihydrofolate reductase